MDTTGMVNLGTEDGLSRFFDIRTDAKGEEFEARTLVTSDYIPTMTQNAWLKVNGNNGWTPGRTMRRIARIDSLAMKIAEDYGYDLDDIGDMRRFLTAHPKWMTVQSFKTSNNPNIIIK